MSRRERAGFTLLEVLIAVFVLGTVLGSLLSLVAGNLSRLSDARGELREARLAEERIREIEAQFEAGEELRDGVDAGRFGAPDDDLAWQVVVEPYRVPVPAGAAGELAASPLFDTGDDRAEAAARRVEVRVFPAAAGPESTRPFVILTVEPLPEEEEAELETSS